MLGPIVPEGSVLLDTNVFVNALTGRGPLVLRQMLQVLPRFFVAAPIRAELACCAAGWTPCIPGPRAFWLKPKRCRAESTK